MDGAILLGAIARGPGQQPQAAYQPALRFAHRSSATFYPYKANFECNLNWAREATKCNRTGKI
jgi:hypothetical protein